MVMQDKVWGKIINFIAELIPIFPINSGNIDGSLKDVIYRVFLNVTKKNRGVFNPKVFRGVPFSFERELF
jgi:hypothetical protein